MEREDMEKEIDVNNDDVGIKDYKMKRKESPPKMNLEVLNFESLSSLANENDDVTPEELLADDTIWLFSHNEEMSSINVLIDDQFRSEGTISYTIDNICDYKNRDDYQLLSLPFYIRMLPWKILIMFRDRTIGIFLQCNAENTVKGAWSCNAIAKFRLLRHSTKQVPFTRPRIKHVFHQKENDFGYSNFISWDDLLNPKNHYVYKNSIAFEVYVAAEIPYGISWDSKSHTGYVGLNNQGATCYMNSLLQSLYFTNELRRAVYLIPTEADDSTKSFGLSLQRIFYELQFGNCSVGTERLTKSFGWNTSESLLQHDVQEFLRILLDKLQTKMKGTCIEGTIPDLFEGKSSSYLYCKNVDYRSTHCETFYDIQLNIKDLSDIYESFSKYISSESLDGDNKYFAGIYGLQEAIKGVIFTKFPPVLHLHLLRFQFDPIINSSVKNNDRFEFYEHINLDNYLSEKESTPADYILHAVLVHSGDNQSGHYVVFISPKADGEWYKFDDDIVSKCKKSEAIEDNYGGLEENSYNQTGSSAYMLIYIRKSKVGSVLADIPENDIPSDLVDRLELDKRIENAYHNELLEPKLYITASVILEELFQVHNRKFLFDETKMKQRLFKFKVTQTVDEMIESFVNAFGVPKSRMRAWNMSNEDTQQFMYLDFQAEGGRSIDDIIPGPGAWYIFLEFARPDDIDRPLPPFNSETDILLFLKFFNPSDKSLNYIGCSQQPLTRKLSDLMPEVNRHLGFDVNTELEVIDECTAQKIYLVNNALQHIFCFHRENQQGHILVFERKNGGKPCAVDFFTDLLYRINVKFCDRINPSEPDIIIELSHHDNYNEMAKALAERLNTDPQKIQFFLNINSYKAVPYTFKGILSELFARIKEGANPKFYYEKLSFHVHELENKKQFKCTWISNDCKEHKDLVLLVNKHGKVREVLDGAIKHIPVDENSPKKLVLLKVLHERIVTIYKNETSLDKLCDAYISSTYQQHEFYIEEVPSEDLDEMEMFVPVGHYCKDVYNSFGVPFLIKACQGEPYGEVMERVQNRLNIPEKEWENYKFAIVSKAGYTMDVNSGTPVDLKIYKKMNTTSSCLTYFGINHINKLKRHSSNNSVEIALKIYN